MNQDRPQVFSHTKSEKKPDGNKYQMLQLKIMERVPVIHGNGFWDNQDNYYSDIELLPEDIKDDVKLYRMIQAQSLIDANNKMEELFYIN